MEAYLNKEQIEYIRKKLKENRSSRSFLFEEWFDHVCCDIETRMKKGISFDKAYRQVVEARKDSDVRSAHTSVQEFLNHPYVGIKKLLLFSFLVFSASWLVNLQYGAAWIGLGSFFVLGLVYFRISIDFFRKRYLSGTNTLLSILSLLAFAGTVSGIILIFLYRNYGINTRGHGVDFTIFAWFFFSLSCLIYYSREKRSAIEESERKKYRWFTALSVANLILSSLSIATFPLYRQVQAYLFWFILFILVFNILVIGGLIVSRSLKNTLILTLFLGSFMIVFIHSHFRSMLPGGKPKLHQVTLQYRIDPPDANENIYISMFYDKFPDKPITLPMQKTGDNAYEISMPSYAYRGFLFYSIRTDSSDASEYFRHLRQPDSVEIRIPGKTVYQLIN